ncbi:MAG: hypothetical protein ACRDL5_01115, partial [Solirubrobacteraceae bacterium]
AAPRGRRRTLPPQARLAAMLGGRTRELVCEELVLRARLDLDEDRPREAAVQLLAALDAALAELPADPAATALADRVAELGGLRSAVAECARSALAGDAPRAEADLSGALARLEATLRARAAAIG